MAFRNPKYIKNYVYNKRRPFSNVVLPGAGIAQNKNNHVIYVDETNSSDPINWYNGYLSLKVSVPKLDGTDYAAADMAGLINGGWSLINRLVVKYNNVSLLLEHGINHCVNIKVLNEFDKGYADTIGQALFNYPDTTSGAAAANAGFAKRKELTSAGATCIIQIPLRLYGFFQSCKLNLLPNGHVSFDITFEDDNVLIHRAHASVARV